MCAHTKLCVCMVQPRALILVDVHASFNIDSKNYIFRDIIKQRYNMWDQTNMLEILKTKLTWNKNTKHQHKQINMKQNK